MTAVKSVRLKELLRVAFGAALLLAVASAAWAQVQPQNLTIGFQFLGSNVRPANVPLSDWASAGIALLIALTACVVLQRRKVRGGRFLGAMVAIIAGAAMLGIAGQGLIGEARAIGPVTIIDLSINPTLNVAPFLPASPLTVSVSNTTGQSVQLTSITLAPGTYAISTPTTCAVSLILVASATCTITLAAS
jgi:hypothetical protein